MIVFSWIILLVTCFYLLFCYFTNKKMHKAMIITSNVLISFSIFIFCIRLVPPESFDVYRYFDELIFIRKLNFFEIINLFLSKANFLWVLLETIAAKFSNNNYIIYSLTLLPTLFIFFFILYKIKEKYKINDRQYIVSLFVFFSIINTVHLMSGLRNALAVSIFSYGFYLFHFFNKKKGIIFYFISLFIHPMTIIFIFIDIISKFFKKFKYIEFIFLFWMLFSKIILFLLNITSSLINVPLINLYLEKLQYVLNTKMGIDYRIVFFEFVEILLIVIALFIIMVIRKNKTKIDKDDSNIINIFYYLCFFIIGSIFLFDFFTRTRFLFAFFSIYILLFVSKYDFNFKLFKKEISFYKCFELSLLLLSLIINFYYIYYMCCNGYFV